MSNSIEKLEAKSKNYFSLNKASGAMESSNYFRQSILYFLEKQAVDLGELQRVMQEKRLEKRLNTAQRFGYGCFNGYSNAR